MWILDLLDLQLERGVVRLGDIEYKVRNTFILELTYKKNSCYFDGNNRTTRKIPSYEELTRKGKN